MERVGGSLAEYIARHELSRSDIATLHSEGALVGLLYSIVAEPAETDAALVLKMYPRLRETFSLFLLVDAVSALVRKRLIQNRDRTAFLDLLKDVYGRENVYLREKIARVWSAVKVTDAIQALSVQKGNVQLNRTISMADGQLQLSVFEDSFYGRTLVTEGTFPDTAIDIAIDFNGQQVREFSCTYFPHSKFVVYASVQVHNPLKGFLDVWLAFRTDITATLPQLAYAAAGFTYVNINKVRVRGAGKIADIVVR